MVTLFLLLDGCDLYMRFQFQKVSYCYRLESI